MMKQVIHEHDAVALLHDQSQCGLVKGDVGVVVYEHDNGRAFEVEFPNPAGKPRFLVLTLDAGDLLKLQSRSHMKHSAV